MKHFAKIFTLTNTLKACALVATLAVGASVMHADPITFTGSTKGAFNGGAVSSTATLNTITFTGSSFNDSTSTGGFVSIGNNTAGDNFGTFSLSNATANYAPGANTFALNIAFTAPAGISGGQSTIFNAIVFGSVTSTSGGGIQVAFSPSTQSYTFANGTQSGNFTLNLNNVAVGQGNSAAVTGYILSSTNAATPEPSSLVMLGTGLVSAAGMLVRRRRIV